MHLHLSKVLVLVLLLIPIQKRDPDADEMCSGIVNGPGIGVCDDFRVEVGRDRNFRTYVKTMPALCCVWAQKTQVESVHLTAAVLVAVHNFTTP